MELIVLAPLAVLLVVIWLWALLDVGNYPEPIWREIGESKTTWMLLLLGIPLFGTLLYLRRIRPRLIERQGTSSTL